MRCCWVFVFHCRFIHWLMWLGISFVDVFVQCFVYFFSSSSRFITSFGCCSYVQQIISNVVGKNSYLVAQTKRTNERGKKRNVKHTHSCTHTCSHRRLLSAAAAASALCVPFNRTEFFQFSSALSVVA